MSQLSDNLTVRREALTLSVTDVHVELNRRGYPVAFSTVAGWFNGSRGVRSMDHLKALCSVLQTSMDALTGDDVALVEDVVGVSIAREIEGLTETQKEVVLAVVRSMKPG